MLTEANAKAAEALPTCRRCNSDSLIALIGMCNADPRPDKIDVGVGVFRDGAGNTPILQVIKEAEQRLRETQVTKAYLGSAGDKRLRRAAAPDRAWRACRRRSDRRACRRPADAARFASASSCSRPPTRQARVLIGGPTWPNHPPIIDAVGLEPVEYPYYERGQGAIRFEDMLESLSGGASRATSRCSTAAATIRPARTSTKTSGARSTAVVAERGLVPFVDMAYQGFGRGLEEDAFGVRLMLDTCDEVVVAQSCDKNFSVYRDRVGSLWIKTPSAEASATAMAHVFQIAREMWSMPPDHGAACVRIVLDDPELRERWLVELTAMRDRINSVRQRIAAADPRLAFIGRQYGMFSMLPLSKEQVLKLRKDEAIYMADSGRFNVVGMGDAQIDRFIAAVVGALDA